MSLELCPECQVPTTFSEIQSWLNNGDIVHRMNDKARMAFIESEHLDPLFENIGKRMGFSIEHLLINISARANARYLAWMIPKEVKDMVKSKELELMPFIEGITLLAETCGVAKYEILGYHYEGDQDDYCHHRVYNPYSLPLAAGGYVGSVMGVVGGEHAIQYKQVLPNAYEFKTHWDEYPMVLKKKMTLVEYHHREGDMDLERCATCGTPKGYSAYQWFPEKGIIKNRETGHRMVLVGPEILDPLFRALVAELGDVFENVVVEAECKVTRESSSPMDITKEPDDLRLELASNGLGNLRELSIAPDKMSVRIDNACFHLVLAGMFKGAFEKIYEVDSNIEWEMGKGNQLELAVTPRSILLPVGPS